MQKGGLVYMVCSPDKTTLNVGVTSDLQNRIWKHKNKFSRAGSPICGVSLVVNPYSATLTSTPGGDLRMSTAVGYVTIDIDSLVPGYPQTLSMVETGATSTFDVSVLCLGTVVGSSVMNSPGTYNITFTPTTPTATIKIQRQFAGTPARYIQFSSMYLPRSDSSILENVVTTVCNGDRYQYGYNGQMKVNEIAGVGNHYQYKFREYDSRTGRFISVDPLAKQYPWNGSYNFAEDRVIDGLDLEGKEYFPGNPGADMLFGWIFRGIEGAGNLAYGTMQYAQGRQTETGVGEGGSHIPEGTSRTRVAGTQKMDGVSYMAIGGTQLALASAEGVMTTMAAVDVAGLGALELLPEVRIGTEIGTAIESEALEVATSNARSIQPNILSQSRQQLMKSKSSLEGLIKERKEKLADFLKDPIGKTSPEKMAEMTKDNPTKDALMKRVMGRAKELERQIRRQETDLDKVNKSLKEPK